MPDFPTESMGVSCDHARGIAPSGESLVVRDPAVLAKFELRRVLERILATASQDTGAAEELLQRVFDTENATSGGVFSDAIHCDTKFPENASARNGSRAQCPRAEGALAKSKGLFSPGDPDYFAPVAIVHRFDLITNMLSTCGEYRIVYAKTSGRSDPKNRVLMIFEGALRNPKPGSMGGCWPLANRIAAWEKEPDRQRVAAEIEKMYFEGIDGFRPVVHAESYGFKSSGCTYAGQCGQLRIGAGMQEPWLFRELTLGEDTMRFQFEPTTVKGSPVPFLFTASSGEGEHLRNALAFDVPNLAKPLVPAIVTSLGDSHNAAESTIGGDFAPSYATRIAGSTHGAALLTSLEKEIGLLKGVECPASDPLTPTSMLRRASAMSCAGCHAPERLVAPDRAIGCGLTWPKSLGETHIDENGNISEALRDVFLPHRARVLTTYLKACDTIAIRRNFIPAFGHQCFGAGTMITMADGSKKPIEQIEVGDRVLSYDENEKELVSGEVTKTFVHPKTDHLVVVNGSLVTTANHPFWSQGKWVAAEELAVGSPLFDGASVNAIEMRDGTATTYNFTVAEYHDYFAGGYLVHNKK